MKTRLHLETLETRLTPSPTPADPFPGWGGAVNHARGDLDGDGVDEWVASVGPGGAPHVRVFWGRTGQLWREWYAYDAAFNGGVWLGVGDFTGNNLDDVVTGAGPGGAPHVRVWDGLSGVLDTEWFAYDAGFLGGVRVACQDTTPGGACEVLTGAGPGGAPHLRVWRNDLAVTWETFVGADPGGVAFWPDDTQVVGASASGNVVLPEIGPGLSVWHSRPELAGGPTLLLIFDDTRFWSGRLAFEVWLRVARLYQTVGVDVTTDAAARPVWGAKFSEVVIAPVPPNPPFHSAPAAVVGLSFEGVWDDAAAGWGKVAWAWSGWNLGFWDERNLSLDVAHEAGHQFGLTHQTTPDSLMAANVGGEYFLPWELAFLAARASA